MFNVNNTAIFLVVIFGLAFIYQSVRVYLLKDRIKEALERAEGVAQAAQTIKIQSEDVKARYEEMKKQPIISCMTDNQVAMLAELLAAHLKNIFPERKERVN